MATPQPAAEPFYEYDREWMIGPVGLEVTKFRDRKQFCLLLVEPGISRPLGWFNDRDAAMQFVRIMESIAR